MKVISSAPVLIKACRQACGPVILVPTMGALHAGHAALIARARKLAGKEGTVVVSIFVNPTQFGPNEDLSRYPRTLKADRDLCQRIGVDLLFTPSPTAMYAPDHSVWVDEERLSSVLCGASRPGHFRGVCTVVSMLFHIVQPDIALFGKKDAQQLAIIRRMVRDLHIPVKIVGVETHREPDGLAMSSRNRYLSPEERREAVVLSRALQEAKEKGITLKRLTTVERQVRQTIEKSPLARIDYIAVVDSESLAPPTAATKRLLLAGAVFFGKTRLIDNVEIPLPKVRPSTV